MSLLEEMKKYLTTGGVPSASAVPVTTATTREPCPAPSLEAIAYPAVNLWEDDDFVYAQAMLPGEKLSDLEITVAVLGDNSHLTIKGARKDLKPEKAVWHRRERYFGSFERTIDLDIPLEANQADALLDDGVLVVKMAKSPEAKPKEIPVKVE